MDMTSCASGQLPFSLSAGSVYTGNSAADVCHQAGMQDARNGGSGYYLLNGDTCDVGYVGNTFHLVTVCDAVSSDVPVASSPPGNTISCNTACTITVIHELSLSPFQLDEAGGALIASAVLAIWAVGYAFRMLIRTLNTDGNQTSNES